MTTFSSWYDAWQAILGQQMYGIEWGMDSTLI